MMKKRFLDFWIPLLVLLSSLLSTGSFAFPEISHHPEDHASYHYFAVELESPHSPHSSHLVARSLQNDLFDASMEIVGHIADLPGHYLVRVHRESMDASHYQLQLEQHPSVKWAQVQIRKQRFKKRAPVEPNQWQKIMDRLEIRDPLAPRQWHLFNVKNRQGDINVTGLWEMGITGKNVVAAVIDDGIDVYHEDLKNNFFLNGSWDFNAKTQIPQNRLAEDIHGTRCAGEIAAVKNGYCGIGVAYDAKISGLRILGGPITDVEEARALVFGNQVNHVYSCSWGPEDDGEHVEGPNQLVFNAMYKSITEGRGGLGTIFVFATGNGGYYGDNCNYDGYTNSIYTISIGAIDYMNRHPAYSEKCAAHLASTYSSGSGLSIVTTDIRPSNCTDTHGGTSAAAPVAVGIFALVLSVRPDLSWRDLQHITIRGAVPFDSPDAEWEVTAAGRKFCHSFAYGKLDAYKAVMVAKEWKKVRDQVSVSIPAYIAKPISIPQKGVELISTVTVTADQLKAGHFERMEHVTVTVNIKHTRRGDLDISLVSPNNIMSHIGPARPHDNSKDGFANWTFSSVKHWEENPVGEWKLIIVDKSNPLDTGTLVSWKLTLWGEADASYSKGSGPEIPTIPVPSPSPPGDSGTIGADKPTAVRNYMYVGLFLVGAVAIVGFFIWRRGNVYTNSVVPYEILDEGELEEALMLSEDEDYGVKAQRVTPSPAGKNSVLGGRTLKGSQATSINSTPTIVRSGVDMGNIFTLDSPGSDDE